MVLVDTTVWIDYLAGTANRQTVWLDEAIGVKSLCLTDLIFCEVLQGVRNDAHFPYFKRDLEQFPILNTGSKHFAQIAAENYRFLRKRGITVRTTIDCLIATFCLAEGHELLHRDRDFDAFEAHLGLRVIHP